MAKEHEFVLEGVCPKGHQVTTAECPVHGEGFAYCEECKACDKNDKAHTVK